jgi:hypothetical protein
MGDSKKTVVKQCILSGKVHIVKFNKQLVRNNKFYGSRRVDLVMEGVTRDAD